MPPKAHLLRDGTPLCGRTLTVWGIGTTDPETVDCYACRAALRREKERPIVLPKKTRPVAIVATTIRYNRALVFVQTNTADEAAAIRAGVAARPEWCRIDGLYIHVERPRDANVGGGALRELIRGTITPDVRDAAKAYLRGLGYTVRARET